MDLLSKVWGYAYGVMDLQIQPVKRSEAEESKRMKKHDDAGTGPTLNTQDDIWVDDNVVFLGAGRSKIYRELYQLSVAQMHEQGFGDFARREYGWLRQ